MHAFDWYGSNRLAWSLGRRPPGAVSGSSLQFSNVAQPSTERRAAVLYYSAAMCFLLSARQHICYSAIYAMPVRLSVTRVNQSKTVDVRITQPSPQSYPMTLVF